MKLFLKLIVVLFIVRSGQGFTTTHPVVNSYPDYIQAIQTIKQSLNKDLKKNYLPLLQDQFGECEAGGINCLFQKDDVVTLETKDKEICFPYTECGFYKCMEKKYQCKKAGYNYFVDLAYPTCNSYVKNLQHNKFTKQGVEWIYTVMTCLQKGLIDECERNDICSTKPQDRKKTCDHITEFTLEFHPGCYINSGVGVCHLPMKDKLMIWKTVSPYLTPRERREAYKVVFHCLFVRKDGTILKRL